MSTDTFMETEVVAEVQTSTGDHDLFAHYAHKEDIVRSAVERVPITALCGKQWVPNKNPQNYPVCPECKDLLDKYWPENVV